jgi:uncharacterized protein (TIGR02452 family)
MFDFTHNRRTVWVQTKSHYKYMSEIESKIFRRNSDISSNEINSLERIYPSVVKAPIIEKDCIYVAIEYKEKGFNPILLNMSDWEVSGGGVDYGSPAQEEELFRRSNYYKHLSQKLYPLYNLDTTISNNVEFFRYGIDKGYTIMDKPIQIDCIGAPALRLPLLNSDRDYLNEKDKEIMRQKIRMLLLTAAQNGNDTIILSAWGCGAYGCPPKSTALLFKEVLTEFAGVFRETPFAILGNNYQYFYDVFNTE